MLKVLELKVLVYMKPVLMDILLTSILEIRNLSGMDRMKLLVLLLAVEAL